MNSFVYCWTDHKTKKLYVGWHKGDTSDGYISSSKAFLKEYKERPEDFSRQIIANGEQKDMQRFENVLLESVNAAKDDQFYNKHNGGKNFVCNGHSEETRNKLRKPHSEEAKLKKKLFWRSQTTFNCIPEKAQAAWKGKKHTEQAKANMKINQAKHSLSRSERMKLNNPMKNKKTADKMVLTRNGVQR